MWLLPPERAEAAALCLVLLGRGFLKHVNVIIDKSPPQATSFFPSTQFSLPWNMIQSGLGSPVPILMEKLCHLLLVFQPSNLDCWITQSIPALQSQPPPPPSPSSFPCSSADPLIRNSSVNTVLFSSSKPPRAVASPAWNVPFNTHFWSNYGSKNLPGKAASLLMVTNGADTSRMLTTGSTLLISRTRMMLGSARSFGT